MTGPVVLPHDLAEVEAAVAAAVERHPNHRNPSDGENCLNTSKRGSHCIAAQVLVDLGYAVGEYGGAYNSFGIVGTLIGLGIEREFTARAQAYLEQAQAIFDRGVPRKWSTCYRELVRYYSGTED